LRSIVAEVVGLIISDGTDVKERKASLGTAGAVAVGLIAWPPLTTCGGSDSALHQSAKSRHPEISQYRFRRAGWMIAK